MLSKSLAARLSCLLAILLASGGCPPTPRDEPIFDGTDAQAGGTDASSSSERPGDVPGPVQSPACNAGETRCAGAVVELCTAAGVWTVKQTCDGACSVGACSGGCKAGDKQCGADQTPATCSADGRWVAGAACPFVCLAKGDCGGVCKPGSRRCGDPPNSLTPYLCDENGVWVAQTACSSLCSSGSCAGSCAPGSKRCGANSTPETCGPMATWEPQAPCPFLCANGACAGECKPGSSGCSGTIQQTCDETGRWRSGTACPFLCKDGGCVGACVPTDRRCDGGTPQSCSAAGLWESGKACDFVCTGKGSCTGVCKPGSVTCTGTVKQTCRADGAGYVDEPCPPLRDGSATCKNGMCGGVCNLDFPKYCPAHGGAVEQCWDNAIDCNTVKSCTDRDRACPTGLVVNCDYADCSTTATTCPTGLHLCPASGRSGPNCYPNRIDCSTIVYCEDRDASFGCDEGYFMDCASDSCKSRCTEPANPVICVSANGFGLTCARPGTDCGTRKDCGGMIYACAFGEVVQCLPTVACVPN